MYGTGGRTAQIGPAPSTNLVLAREGEAELADLDFVTTGEREGLDLGAVDVGAVEAAGIDDPVFVVNLFPFIHVLPFMSFSHLRQIIP